jgi:Spy/CpxP family protein refolding chaperone
MLPSTTKIIWHVALALVLCAGPALAQRGGRRGGMGGSSFGRTPANVVTKEDTVDLFAVLLDLNDSQRQQLDAILDVAIRAAGPIQDQLNKGTKLLFEAAKSGKSDLEINKLADQQGLLAAQMLALQARSFAKLCSMLTGDQPTKVETFLYDRIGSLLSAPVRPAVAH